MWFITKLSSGHKVALDFGTFIYLKNEGIFRNEKTSSPIFDDLYIEFSNFIRSEIIDCEKKKITF